MAKCHVFSFVDGLDVVVPDGLEMLALVGDGISVGVVKFLALQGGGLPARSHSHGEEVSLQIRGGCVVLLGHSGQAPSGEMMLAEGATMSMPAEQPHYGINRFDATGVSLRLNVVTPPRREYGNKGDAKVFYPLEQSPAA